MKEACYELECARSQGLGLRPGGRRCLTCYRLRRFGGIQPVPRRQQGFDRVGEVLLGDMVIAPLDAQTLSGHQHIDVAEPLRRLELVARELDLESVRVLQVDRVHESAVALDELDAALAQ